MLKSRDTAIKTYHFHATKTHEKVRFRYMQMLQTQGRTKGTKTTIAENVRSLGRVDTFEDFINKLDINQRGFIFFFLFV